MRKDSTIQDIIRVAKQTGAKSAFLYGSRSRRESTTSSDYDVGLIFDDNKYVSNKRLRQLIPPREDVSYKTTKLSEIETCTSKIILPRAIFYHDLKSTATTIYGAKIIESISPPPITVLDLIQTIRFEMGLSFCSSKSYRRGEIQTASEELSKSCLHGLKALQIFKLRKFPTSYRQIYKLRKRVIDNADFLGLIDTAYNYRTSKDPLEENYIFINMALLDYIEKQITALSSAPDTILIN